MKIIVLNYTIRYLNFELFRFLDYVIVHSIKQLDYQFH